MNRPTCLALLGLIAVGCTGIEFADGGTSASGGASSGGADMGGASTAGTGAAGAGGAGGENCTNGTDDDNDGLSDCDDPDCDALCNVPEGWTGPVRAGSCGDVEPLLQAFVSASGSTECACACVGVPECGEVTIAEFGGQNCNGAGSPVALTSGCVPLSGGTDSVFVTIDGASCNGAPGAGLVEPSVDAEEIELCGDPLGDCVFQLGEHACPVGLPNASTYSLELADTRACLSDACDCNAQCLPVVLAADGCSVPITFPPAGCLSLPGNDGLGVLVQSASSCFATGTATSTGSVALTGAVTVCCR